MNVLDYWSGEIIRSHKNWKEKGWVETLQELTRKTIHAITCYDPLCIKGDITIWDTPGDTFHYTSNVGNIMERAFDAMCLFNPNPMCAVGRQLWLGESWFQHGRYLSIAAYLIQDCLVPGGDIFVQFDDEMDQWDSWRGREIFLEKLQVYTDDGIIPVQEWGTEAGQKFQNDSYCFCSLHHFRKK